MVASPARPLALPAARAISGGAARSAGRRRAAPVTAASGSGRPEPSRQRSDAAADFATQAAKALGGLFGSQPGTLGGLPSLAEPAEALRQLGQLAESLREQVAERTRSVLEDNDYGYESSYDGEEEEDAGRSAAGLAARSRMLATLALDRRERLQDQTLDAMQPPPAAATEQLEPEVAEGSPSPDRQRALAMAALKAAREDASLRLSTQWSSDVEGAYRARSRRPETVVREVYVPPPRPRAVDAPLGTMGALGLLQDEWSGDGEALTQQSAPESERDEEHGARVAADVDAILSSALSELGMEMEARVAQWRNSGEQ